MVTKHKTMYPLKCWSSAWKYFLVLPYKWVPSKVHPNIWVRVDTDIVWGGKGVLKPPGKTRIPFSHFSQYLSDSLCSGCHVIEVGADFPSVRKSLCSSLTIAFKPWGEEHPRLWSLQSLLNITIHYFTKCFVSQHLLWLGLDIASKGLPRQHSGRESACQCGRCNRPGSIPGLGRSPTEGNRSPLQHSCLGNSTASGAWRATAHGVTELETTEQTHNKSKQFGEYAYSYSKKFSWISLI